MRSSYAATFLFLAGVAAAGLALFLLAMPETSRPARERADGTAPA